MIIDSPRETDLPGLRALWKQAFGDSDAFLDGFYSNGYSPQRCRLVRLEGHVAAAVYWFDCACQGQPMAYLYAVATHRDYRGRGLCRSLLADTHRHLKELGYAGTLLVPHGLPLFAMYEKLGFSTICQVKKFDCAAGPEKAALRQISPAEYAALRRSYLPEGAVIQEGQMLVFLSGFSAFYAGDGWLLCATLEDGRLFGSELLGDPGAAPGILAALGATQGSFRTPGGDIPFAMYQPLCPQCPLPSYFGLPMD